MGCRGLAILPSMVWKDMVYPGSGFGPCNSAQRRSRNPPQSCTCHWILDPREPYPRSAKERKTLSAVDHMLHTTYVQDEPFWVFSGSHAFQATDPRDQVFALLGLADEESRTYPLLQPRVYPRCT